MVTNLKPEYATFWQRLLAFLLDGFIIVIPVFMVTLQVVSSFLFDAAAIKAAPEPDFEMIYQLHQNLVFIMIAGVSASALATAAFINSRWQASPGKRLVGIYITKTNGSKPTFADAFGRFVSLPFFIMMIQIFERGASYEKLTALKASGKVVTDAAELQAQLMTPYSQITGLVVFVTLSFWFLRIFFNREKAALHDTLFATRVMQGRR